MKETTLLLLKKEHNLESMELMVEMIDWKVRKTHEEIIFHARLGSIPVEKVQTHTNILPSKR